jgi:hypothetical protein
MIRGGNPPYRNVAQGWLPPQNIRAGPGTRADVSRLY